MYSAYCKNITLSNGDREIGESVVDYDCTTDQVKNKQSERVKRKYYHNPFIFNLIQYTTKFSVHGKIFES